MRVKYQPLQISIL